MTTVLEKHRPAAAKDGRTGPDAPRRNTAPRPAPVEHDPVDVAKRFLEGEGAGKAPSRLLKRMQNGGI